MKTMARNAGISRDITNKSERVTSITRMMAARVPPEVIAQITGHRNLKTLGRYDKVAFLKAQATQELLRHPYHPETHQMLTFEYHSEKVMREYHQWQVSNGISVDVDDVGTRVDTVNSGMDFEDNPNDISTFVEPENFEDVNFGIERAEDENVNPVVMEERVLLGRGFPSIPDIPINGRGSVIHVSSSSNQNSGFAQFASHIRPLVNQQFGGDNQGSNEQPRFFPRPIAPYPSGNSYPPVTQHAIHTPHLPICPPPTLFNSTGKTCLPVRRPYLPTHRPYPPVHTPTRDNARCSNRPLAYPPQFNLDQAPICGVNNLLVHQDSHGRPYRPQHLDSNPSHFRNWNQRPTYGNRNILHELEPISEVKMAPLIRTPSPSTPPGFILASENIKQRALIFPTSSPMKMQNYPYNGGQDIQRKGLASNTSSSGNFFISNTMLIFQFI